MPKQRFLDLLREQVVLFDGGMGTMLYEKGIFINRCFEELNLSEPGLVKAIHAEYVEAGADIIETNTFGANAIKLEQHGFKDNLAEINYKGAKIAREAAGELWVAGSIGPLGIRIEPWGPTSVEEARAHFRQQAQALLEGGVDLFVLETFSDINELHQAILAVRELDPERPIISQMTLGEDGESLYGTSPELFGQRLTEWGADVVGVNCSVGPAIMLDAVYRLAHAHGAPVSVMPNAGLPRNVDGRSMYLASPEYMASYTRRFVDAGARVVGGCCGTTPAHVRAMHQALRGSRPRLVAPTHVGRAISPALVSPVPRDRKSRLSKRLTAGEFTAIADVTPPRGLDFSGVLDGVKRLKAAGVDYVVVSEPPRASARMSCNALAQLLEKLGDVESIVHYSCRDRRLLDMQSDLIGAHALGLRNVILETGVAPTLALERSNPVNSDVDSIGLTHMVRRLNDGVDLGLSPIGTPTGWHIGVVANATAVDLEEEIRRFEWKVDAGAEFCITRPIFDPEQLRNFLKRIEHCRIPVLVGVRPLASFQAAEFLSNEVPGMRLPDSILMRMRDAADRSEDHAAAEGVAIAIEVLREVRELVQGVVVATRSERFDAAIAVLGAVET